MLELKIQVKELDTKLQLMEKELEQECKVKRQPALENDDARDKSPFNWTRKKRDISDWASRIDHFLTPDRSTARFEVNPEMSRPGDFSRYRRLRHRSLIFQYQKISPRVGLRYNMGVSVSSI